MHRTIMSFLGAAVLCLLAAGDFRGAAEAAVVPVSRANVEGNIADGDETTKTLQEIIDDDATYVGDRDVLDFAPGEYEDAGELLVTRPLTLRKAPGSEGDVKFTGKFMINIKSDDVVVEGLTFKDVTVPDVVTVKLDLSASTAGNQPLLYGFPGKTLADFLEEQISGFTLDQTRGLWCSWDEDDEVHVCPIVDYTDDVECDHLPHNDELWVTVAGPSVAADNGKIANKSTGAPVEFSFNSVSISGEAITSAAAKNGLGTIWVDAQVPDACETDDSTPPVEVAEISGVVIRGNTFDGTEVAAIRGGDQGPPLPILLSPERKFDFAEGKLTGVRTCLNFLCTSEAVTYVPCQTELDVIANTFENVGGTGGFAKDSAGNFFEDDDGNRIAEVGNREPAIDLGSVARAKITDNTIDGGTWDAVVLRRTPEGARIDIRNNLITDTILDGIKIIGDSKVNAQSETEITVMGNRVTGTSMNRYITLHNNSWDAADYPIRVEPGYFEQRDYCTLVTEGLFDPATIGPRLIPSYTESAVKLLNRFLAPEIWRSAKPGFSFSAAGAPASNLGEDGYLKYFTIMDDFYYYGEEDNEDVVGYTALVRISAAGCYTSRIKVMEQQEGVSIIGNDLGYEPDFSGITPAGSPGYGLVVSGTGTTLAAFSGNNIDHFGQASVLSATGKAIPTNGNYLGPTLRVQTGTEISFAAADASESEPLTGTPDAPRGPRDSMLDLDSPMLTGAEVNEAGTELTLTYSENLDGTSTLSAGDFVITIRKQAAVGRSFVTSPTEVAVDGMRVVLTLRAGIEIEAGDVITVTYSGGGIRDAAGNVAEAITTTSQTVTNNVGRGSDTGPGTAAGGGTGGCVLASDAGNGTYAGMLLPLMFAGLVFGMRRFGRKGL